jgi:hypothetical protein
MLYFQSEEENPNPYQELEEELIDFPEYYDTPICRSWEGIPA